MKVKIIPSQSTDSGDKYELEIRGFKSFEAAFNQAKKILSKADANKPFDEQLEILAGVSRGFSAQLLTAITGKNCSKYYGKYDEVGVHAHIEIAGYWLNFLKANIKSMTVEQFEKYLSTVQSIKEYDGYGFQIYFCLRRYYSQFVALLEFAETGNVEMLQIFKEKIKEGW